MLQNSQSVTGKKKLVIATVSGCILLLLLVGIYFLFVYCDHDYDTGTITKSATCTVEGIRTLTCQKCNKTMEETIGITDHTFSETIKTAPTCNAPGKKLFFCTVCNYSKEKEIPPTETHSFLEEIISQPTCGADGTIRYACEICHFSKDEALAATGSHSFTKKTVKESTCTEKGLMIEICSVCNAEGENSEKELADHAYVCSTKAASCVATGLNTYCCSNCDYTYTETIPKTSHTWEKWETITAATYESTGSRTRTCKTCKKTETETIPIRILSEEDKRQMALQVAKEIASTARTYATPIEQITYAAEAVAGYCAKAAYTTEGKDYRQAYGVFIKGEYSCAGATRALGMVLECMGYQWNHLNENKWTHQWCQVFIDGQKYWADGQIGMAGIGEHPFV